MGYPQVDTSEMEQQIDRLVYQLYGLTNTLKIERIGTPLKEWDINIYYGIKTGYNKAFIIDGKTKDELIRKDRKSKEIIKPILRGRDIKRYKAEFADLWLIATFPALKLNIDDYPAIKKYLEQFLPKIKQTGEMFIDKNGKKQKTRKKTGNKWFETQDQIAYYKEFEKEKIVWQRVTKQAMFCLVPKNMFILDSGAFITLNNNLANNNLVYLCSILNSKLIFYYFSSFAHQLGNTAFLCSNQYVERLPIPKISKEKQQSFIKLVDQILSLKKAGEDTVAEEQQIDRLVYQLYGLTETEIRIVEGKEDKVIIK